jgi:hypothetical protein
MWQRFTERARRIVFFAQEEAGRLGENYVSTEHLLLGMIRETDCVGARILVDMGVDLSHIRNEIEKQVAAGGSGRLGQDMQLTPRAKKVIDLAYDEARQLNNNHIGTEHLLLGMIREGEGLAWRVLTLLRVHYEPTRSAVIIVQKSKAENTGEEVTSLARKLRNSPGDLGRLTSLENREGVEVAVDAAAVRELHDVFLARDGYGYQELLDLGRVFVAATGELVKNLVIPRETTMEPTPDFHLYVRILEGVHEGRKGWIATEVFTLVGPDEAPFPPHESSLDLDPDGEIF